MMPNPSFDEIDRTWATVQDAYPDAFMSASAQDRPRVQTVRDLARDAWYAALNKMFSESDPAVAHLTADLEQENDAMQADLDSLKQAANFLGTVAGAVKTATTLASLAT